MKTRRSGRVTTDIVVRRGESDTRTFTEHLESSDGRLALIVGANRHGVRFEDVFAWDRCAIPVLRAWNWWRAQDGVIDLVFELRPAADTRLAVLRASANGVTVETFVEPTRTKRGSATTIDFVRSVDFAMKRLLHDARSGDMDQLLEAWANADERVHSTKK